MKALHRLMPLFMSKSLRLRLRLMLSKSGLQMKTREAFSKMIIFAGLLNLVVVGFLLYKLPIIGSYNTLHIIGLMLSGVVALFFLVFIIVMTGTLLLLNLRIYSRKVQVEEVFAEFLQLTSTNIRAGMTIDQAIFNSIRPRFGILAKEVERVAKESMTGKDLVEALQEFADNYDSRLIKQSVNLLGEGIRAGGEIGELLEQISWNLVQTKAMQKEMAASVTSYVIFISFATIVAAPFLFALSGQLLQVMQQVTSSLDLETLKSTSMNLPFSFGQQGVSQADFQIFAVVCLLMTSLSSAMLISTILKGNVKGGIKYLPIFIISTMTLFLGFQKALQFFFGGII